MTDTTTPQPPHVPDRPAGGWIEGVEEIYQGRWTHPVTGERSPRAPFELIEIAEDLDGPKPTSSRAWGWRARSSSWPTGRPGTRWARGSRGR
jgi:hypothetical protein